MRLIIQRVLEAAVSVNGAEVSRIGKGILVFVGICRTDTDKDATLGANKLLGVRLWPHEQRAWAKSCKDLGYEILIVSQFTLYAEYKGNKPDYHNAMATQEALAFYNAFVQQVKTLYDANKVQEGTFGAMMEVSLINDGPVTMQWDSRKFSYVQDIKQ
eukprot:TRINITY_DN12861_c0_g1_i2.p1 TRINITY_DN12861_c0_g1~~TRINITY_DN12861_c0_g1_i2.p1  ORF type:complete len:158 (-),score=21.68 TRINITY_DN12861_c0_g1_i2:145-618(-)